MQRYKGIMYPLSKDPQGFMHSADTDLDQIKSDMATIILTEPRERVFEPAFGTNLLGVSIAQPMEILKGQFRLNVALSLKKWEKRIQVKEVNINLEVVDNNLILMISVYFIDPVNMKATEELHVQKSLGGVDGRTMPF
jgi:phage baseplate assembly protein W